MASDLMRPLSSAELVHLRRTQDDRARTGFALAMFFLTAFILMALGFGLRIYLDGARGVGAGLIAAGVTLVALMVWLARLPNKSATMKFRPLIVGGPLRSRIKSTGKMKEKIYYIGADAVVFPRHWYRTLERRGDMLRARAALPESMSGSSDLFPCILLEVEEGPSIDFERVEVPELPPAQKPWASLGAVLGGFAAIGLIGGTLGWQAGRADLARSWSALRAELAPAVRFHDGEALAAAPPVTGRVVIEAAWRVDASDLDGAPDGAHLLVITKAARERIVALRQPLMAAYTKAWQRYQDEVEDYEKRYPRDPLEAYPGLPPAPWQHPAKQRPPRPSAPVLPSVSLESRDLLAVMPSPATTGLPDVQPPQDRLLLALQSPATVEGEIYSPDTPVLLYPHETADNWREGGLFLGAGILSLAIFLACASLLLRDHLRGEAIAKRIRQAYASSGQGRVLA